MKKLNQSIFKTFIQKTCTLQSYTVLKLIVNFTCIIFLDISIIIHLHNNCMFLWNLKFITVPSSPPLDMLLSHFSSVLSFITHPYLIILSHVQIILQYVVSLEVFHPKFSMYLLFLPCMLHI